MGELLFAAIDFAREPYLRSMQKFLCAASSDRSNLKGDRVMGGDGVLAVAMT